MSVGRDMEICGKENVTERISSSIYSLMEEHFPGGDGEKSSHEQTENREALSKQSRSVFSLLRQILRQSIKYKMVALASALAYWLLYAYSSGMFFYYTFDVLPYVKEDGLSNPQFYPPGNLAGLYYAGMIWYPTSHLQLNFFLGQTFFSILLAVLFSLSILLLSYSFRFKGMNKKQQGFAGFFGVIPALFSGGCCAVPVATLLLGSIVPVTVLANIEFEDPLLLNLFIVILMLSSIYYTGRKIIKTANSCEVCKP